MINCNYIKKYNDKLQSFQFPQKARISAIMYIQDTKTFSNQLILSIPNCYREECRIQL